MKELKNILSLVTLLIGVMMGFAQQNRLHTTGAWSDTKSNMGDDSIRVNIRIGEAIFAPMHRIDETVDGQKRDVHLGFYQGIKHFTTTFSNGLFASKGYFPDGVELRWNIIGQEDVIKKLMIFRKEYGTTVDSTLIASISKDESTYRDDNVQFGKLYEYTLYAKGISDAIKVEHFNYVKSFGFALPSGKVTGQVTFEGGNAVKGANVIAEPSGDLTSKSILFDGSTKLNIPHRQNHSELGFENGFTLQMWAKATNGTYTLFDKGGIVKLSYGAGKYLFQVGGQTLEQSYTPPTDSFHHVAVNYDPATKYAKMYITSNGRTFIKDSLIIDNAPTANTDNLFFGQGLVGNMDEIRLWNEALMFEDIKSNHYRFIQSGSRNLKGYWKLEIGKGNEFYDYAKQGVVFSENHGVIEGFNAANTWSEEVASRTQLAYRAITDENGSYVLEGLPFESSGSTYKIVPIYEQHEFDPSEQVRILDPNNSSYSEVNFKDVSSFKVTGLVRYFNTTFPVADVLVFIDGNPATDKEGDLVRTNAKGEFEVQVPIGYHFIKMKKGGHTFYKEGRFPEKEGEKWNFVEPVTGLVFVDSTLVKVSGRVVGGLVQGSKPLGFGKSKNNIGNATLTFTKKNNNGNLVLKQVDKDNATVGFLQTKDINGNITGDVEQIGALNSSNWTRLNPVEEKNKQETQVLISSDNTFANQTVTVNTDVNSGEYIAYLPPEEYTVEVTPIGNTGQYDEFAFQGVSSLSLNIKNTYKKDETYETELVYINEDNSYSSESFDLEAAKLKYDSIIEVEKFIEDSDISSTKRVHLVGVDSFKYDHRQDFILRNKPVATIRPKGQDYWGDNSFVFETSNEEETEEIELLSSNPTMDYDDLSNYKFGHPIFRQRQRYKVEISLYEEYKKGTEIDRVPVSDGQVTVTNKLAANENALLSLNEKGEVVYEFMAGNPNLSSDKLKSFNLRIASGVNGSIKTDWTLNGGAYVFGAVPTGNNFVTSGPNKIITILRDPPGSLSQSFLEKGTTFTNSYSYSVSDSETTSSSESITAEGKIKSFLGLGAGIIKEIGVDVSAELGFSSESSTSSNEEFTEEFTLTKRWETSSDPEFVGSSGDLFIGAATNIIYGKAEFLEIVKNANDEYEIGIRNGLRLNPKFKTAFAYSQHYIENQLIPNLEEIRNTILQTNTNDYESVITDTEDDNYGISNSDPIWGERATRKIGDLNAPSYIVKHPENGDTILYYNSQINSWKNLLKHNERAKLEAILDENKSFDGTTRYEESTEITETESFTSSYGFVMNDRISAGLGISAGAVSIEVNLETSTNVSLDESQTSTDSNTTTYGYVLEDGDGDDAYTVDVKKPSDGYGPVFSVRGGITSCPYQDREVTKYYKPGEVLHEATVKLQEPQLSIPINSLSDIPDNRTAELMIKMSNASSADEDEYFDLIVDESTNPNGAIIKVDGAPIGNGRTFLVPARSEEALEKTITIQKGSSTVNEYNDIKLILKSRCQYDPTNNVDNIFDEETFSVSFQPSCTDIEISKPSNNWVLNTSATIENVVNIEIGKYDRNVSTFNNVQFQYRALGTSTWKTETIFYDKQGDYDAANDPKELITGAKINYAWDMTALPDREYEIRAVAICDLGGGNLVKTPSVVLQGIKDTKRPQLFGSPQPGDGILSANDEISIQFDEDIVASRLNKFNFSVTGVLNGSPLRHSTSVALDGTNDFVRIKNALTSSSSFTYEIWAKNNQLNKRSVLLSKGFKTDGLIELAYTSDNKLEVKMGTQTITSIAPSPAIDNDWHHYAVSFNKTTKKLSVYKDGQIVIDNTAVTTTPTGEGPIYLGSSAVGRTNLLKGAVHEFRMWNIPLQQTTIASKMLKQLSGSEVGIIGYWQLAEGSGTLAQDKSRGKLAEIHGEWMLLPQGFAAQFDGTDDYLKINTGSTVTITPNMDYTIEMWFKAADNGVAQTLFSCGKGDGTDNQTFNKANERLSINLTANKAIKLFSNGQELSLDDASDYIDNNWHHLAVTLKRKGNIVMYLDGEPKISKSANLYGGIVNSRIWLGARASIEGASTVNFDQHLKGGLDEVRIWKLAKTQEQIKLDKHAAISGEEMGLVAYYPFEQFVTNTGIQESISTLNDRYINMIEQSDGTLANQNGGTATENGGVVLNNETPKIAKARPVSKVNFSWAVNGDKIIITPDASQAELIENVILEITITEVEDYRENTLSSPVTWTAYVDRNPMSWEKAQLDFVKDSGEPFSFKTKIINNGGSNEAYSLEGLPLWLKASPEKGSLSPLSEKEITFTVSPDLNIGDYSEDIRLTTGFGFDEIMILNMNVKKDPPTDWVVKLSDYSYTMNIIGKLEVDGILSTDEEDVLAVFVNDTIRGKANVKYIEEKDDYQVFLTVYSNSTDDSENLEFRIWDASEGVVRGSVTPSYNFEANKLIGLSSSPILFKVRNTLVSTVSFKKGWQWISFNLFGNELTSSKKLFEGMQSSEGDIIKGINAYDQYNATTGWIGAITSNGGFKKGALYKLYLKNPVTFNYSGDIVDPTTTTINIVKGWNWLGFTPQKNIEINEALAGYAAQDGDIIKSQFAFAIYDNDIGWIGSLKSMKAGEGYMLKSTTATSFEFPEKGLINGRIFDTNDDVVLTYGNQTINPRFYEDNVNIIASSNQSLKVGVFVGDELRGVAEGKQFNGKYLYFITAYGKLSDEDVIFKGLDEDENEFVYENHLTISTKKSLGSLKDPVQLVNKALGVTSQPNGVVVYPNPFENELRLRLSGNIATVKLLDVSGRTKATFESLGNQEYYLNTSEFKSGIYFVNIIFDDDKMITLKTIKK